jgi:hypothetical protein
MPQNLVHFGNAEHHRQLSFSKGAYQVQRSPLSPKGMHEKELDTGAGDAKRVGGNLSVILEVEEVLAQFLFTDTIWGLAIVFGQLPHDPHVGYLGILGQASQLQVLDHPLS